MASVLISLGDVPATRPAAPATRRWAASGLLHTLAEFTGSLLFLAILAWEVWHIGSPVLQIVVQKATGSGYSEPTVQGAQWSWPANRAWPWP